MALFSSAHLLAHFTVSCLESASSCGTAAIKIVRMTTADDKGEGDNELSHSYNKVYTPLRL